MRITQNRWLKYSVLALLLFAQAAMALDACVSASAKANDAFVVMPPDCDMVPAPANLCLMQCLSQDQSDSDARIAQLPTADAVVLRLPRDDPTLRRAGALPMRPARLCTGPPLSQLCRLRL